MRSLLVIAVAAGVLTACAGSPEEASARIASETDPGRIVPVRDTVLPDVFEAAATTEPFQQAVLSTRLLSRVESVPVREGDRVAAGAVLVRLDGRDLVARREQSQAALRTAEAAHREAALHEGRIRSLYADSAAPRAQLDAAVAGLTRAEQMILAARAGVAEVEAMADYSVIVAPFAGTVVRRLVDPGTLAAPGSPLVMVEDASRLRLVAAVTPPAAVRLRRGMAIDVSIEGVLTRGQVEGVVPAGTASLVSVQVIVENPRGQYSSGSAAAVLIPGHPRTMLLVPVTSVVRSGDLTGVRVPSADGTVTRWVRLGRQYGDLVEVLSGLVAGDSVVNPEGR